ncbi:hypothetical protein PSPO01_09047 [Paraphaeosphaeria sporulosa]
MCPQILLCRDIHGNKGNNISLTGRGIPLARPLTRRTASGHSTARVPYRPFSEQPAPVQEAYQAEIHMRPFRDRQAYGYASHGAWWCCRCRHENEVVHRSGNRPFGRMNCGNCDRLFCGACVTTNILGQDLVDRRPYNQTAIVVPHYDDKEVPYGVVCPKCGLSRRAEALAFAQLGVRFSAVQFDQLRCRCGNVSTSSWHRFSIGSPYDWLGDRTACYGRALMERIDQSRRNV